MTQMVNWMYSYNSNTVFSDAQDLRTCHLQPGVTVGNTETLPYSSDNVPCAHDTHPAMVEKPSPIIPVKDPHRSACIANLSDNILGAKSSAYIQVPNMKPALANISPPDEAVEHMHANEHSELCTHPRRFHPLHL